MAVPQHEQRLLCQKSGNRCAFPGCRRVLTADANLPDRDVVLGEIAHIVGESLNGPRGASPLSLADRNRYDNLILLCSQHHQVVDAQPQTYTVERLHAIKDEHERWVEKTLGPTGPDPQLAKPTRVVEAVHSTLLPIERLPKYVYGVPCTLSNERAVAAALHPLREGETAPFIVRAGMLFTFQDLYDRFGPFRDLVPGRGAERFLCRDWWDDPDYMRWFMDLMNRVLNKLTGRRGLMLDREHRRYYFAPEEAGQAREIEYRPLNQKSATRKVVWEPQNKRTGQGRGFWYHRAVALRFVRAGQADWCLSIRPELRVTTDGFTPLSSEKIGSKVTKKKSRMFNYDLLAEVNFWRDFLSGGHPRIITSFGRRQHLVVSSTLMQGMIAWPGIPEEHAKQFRNVTYADDLFSWAEFASIEDENDDWDDDADMEDDRESEDD